MAALRIAGSLQAATSKSFESSDRKNNFSVALRPGAVRTGPSKAALRSARICASATQHVAAVATVVQKAAPVEEWNAAARTARLEHLESQALDTLRKTLDNFEHPTFPCALIAGDVVILDLLNKVGAYKNPKFKVVFIDTFHLFDETYAFLKQVEEKYGFKAEVFQAAGLANKEEYVEKHGSDLFIRDIDEYDKICKVEPFGRALKTLEVDAMINGRRRDHGAERAHLGVFEAGTMVKVQPLAYWEFKDCFDYLEANNVEAHPLHAQGFPSIGDVMTTVPVPREQWFEYAGERSGRFQGLTNKDGSTKTECGIHVGDAREVAEE
eukprot:TRINITY_DN29944_c0_g1_i1.p1 TRINITY_DN29944_c0_g1~~TRINITY_DN29944_c0_g1_i1.p1  ORF type:complete len:351 (-),score=66.84 TRINITY_DN29944_c0_g1_i1:449-1420(-)